jgi:hypothetical protein
MKSLTGLRGFRIVKARLRELEQLKGNWKRAMRSFYYYPAHAYRFYFTERTGETRADELRS